MGSSFDRCAFIGLACCALVAAACNRTEGECYPRGEGGNAGPGAGGGPIVPAGAGGFGDAPPPEPQGAGDEAADPCNAAEGKVYTCNGDVVCHHPQGGTEGCHYVNHREGGPSAGQVIERLILACQKDKPGYSCQQDTLTCNDGPVVAPAVTKYVCNGGVSCMDKQGVSEGCNHVAEEVYADDEQDAIDLLVEICEDNLHDKHGNNCDHGGFCCNAGSLTCNKAN